MSNTTLSPLLIVHWAHLTDHGESSLLDDPKIAEIAKKYNKSAAQILIRFQVEHKVVVIPKSVTSDRIKANVDVFDYSLSAEDLVTLESFTVTGGLVTQ